MLNTSSVTDPEAKIFVETWLIQRNLNKEIYDSVPEDKFDFKVTPRSLSTRENLIYQIKVHDNYLKCVEEGVLIHGKHYEELKLDGLGKKELLETWDNIDKKIIEFLSSEKMKKKVILSPNNKEVSVIIALWGLEGHEKYHLGRISVTLEALNIPRSESLKQNWG